MSSCGWLVLMMERVYDPQFRTNLSFASFRSYAQGSSSSRVDIDAVPRSTTELLHLLSTRQVVGHSAKDLVVSFLAANGVEQGSKEHEIFGRLLDRNLAAGFGASTLSELRWEDGLTASTRASRGNGNEVPTPSEGEPAVKRNMKTFPVALGKTIDPPFTDITRSTCNWYASRKLDGVRVITFVDFTVSPSTVEPVLHDVQFLSRTGRPFTSLDNVRDQLARLVEYPVLRERLALNGYELDDGIRRVVLDGEVCVMREKTGTPGQISSHREDDGTGAGAGAIWSDDNLEEDFTSTVSEIRRGPPFTIAHPVYFIFDILDHSTFALGKGETTFGERVEEIRDLGDWLASRPDKGGKVLRPLEQWEVNDPSEIDAMVKRAAEEGWEGLVLRADKPYKGSRS